MLALLIASLLAAAQLDEKLWFVILLALGVWNLGVIAMLLYVVAGPDGVPDARSRQAAVPAGVER